MGTGHLAMPATKRLARVAPEVDLWECTLHSPPLKTNKAESTPALKPRGDVTRNPKTGVPGGPQKGHVCPPKILKKNFLKSFVLTGIPFQMDVLIAKFPREWRGLFTALGKGDEGQEYADLWLTETQHSQFGELADWSGLVQALCELEPHSIGIKLNQ